MLSKKQPAKRLPTKRKKALHSTFRFPEPKQIQFNNRQVRLPKVGRVRFFKSQKIEGIVKTISLSQRSGHWYMAVQVEQAIAEKKHKSQSIVGLDLGIVKFVTTVTEKTAKQYDPKNTYRYLEKKLVKEQKKLKNKEKHSENWKRQIRRIQKVHQKIANSRNDFLHKLSTEISKNHAIIVMEDLKVSNMSKSSKGTVMQPGRNVRAKSSLNKSILDQGWHQFKQQLKYKSQWQGGKLILVEAKYTMIAKKH